MSVANATPEQLAELSAFVVLQRATAGEFFRVMNHMNALNNSWNATISAIIGTPAGTTIVDNSGLAGIVPLTDTDATNIMSYMQNTLTNFYDAAHQQELTKACGPSNTIG